MSSEYKLKKPYVNLYCNSDEVPENIFSAIPLNRKTVNIYCLQIYTSSIYTMNVLSYMHSEH